MPTKPSPSKSAGQPLHGPQEVGCGAALGDSAANRRICSTGIGLACEIVAEIGLVQTKLIIVRRRAGVNLPRLLLSVEKTRVQSG